MRVCPGGRASDNEHFQDLPQSITLAESARLAPTDSLDPTQGRSALSQSHSWGTRGGAADKVGRATMTNTQLRQDVVDELEFEPSIDAASIGVAVDDGVVTLTGHVPNYAQKLFVETAVRRVRGVRGVRAIAQEIQVRYPSDPKTSDDEIAKRALDALRWDVTVPERSSSPSIRGS